MAELRKRMNAVVANRWQIFATIAARLGKSRYTKELKKTIDLLDRYRILRLEDTLYDYLDDHPA